MAKFKKVGCMLLIEPLLVDKSVEGLKALFIAAFVLGSEESSGPGLAATSSGSNSSTDDKVGNR